MPRPPFPEHERALVRERILAAAQTLFDEDGIEAVSMRAIGARVDLSASALYAYFPSKGDLVRTLWLGALGDLTSRIQKVSASARDPIQAIREMAVAYLEFGLENPVRFRVLFLLDLGPMTSELAGASENYTPYYALRGCFEEAIRRGLITRFSDPEIAAQALWSAVHGVITLVNTCAEFPLRPTSDLIEAVLDSMLAGMAGGNPR